ncbi:MAG TPA: divergent polysaccharide deacetylase family protein [Caulobacteraceae bacterium]|nr:divergent polysaccharide deacetylase family protein [Caulobacteraceae bacterium]
MFSKKLSTHPALPASESEREGFLANLPTNRYTALAGAVVLLVAAGAGLVAVMGNPRDGDPVVRTPIAFPKGVNAADWRASLSPDDPAASSLPPDAAMADMAGQDGMSGEAVILMPGDGQGHAQPLPQAPIAGLTSPGPGGLLPIIAPDGRTPWKAYARPFADNGRPKVALVIGGLGLNAKSTRDAIERLPPEITLSFVPYADGLQGWIDLARANGHEVLLEIPMEPLDFPENDPGPYTLMASDPPTQTVQRLEWLMSRATGYFGVTNYLGGRFVQSDKGMTAFAQALRQRGVAFIDDGSAAKRAQGIPRASAGQIVDEQLDSDAIDRQLLTLEASALQNGAALGSGFAYPLTIAQVQKWAASVGQRGYALAPASAVMTGR